MFSSPLWGFFYLIPSSGAVDKSAAVLVPSLGILLFNMNSGDFFIWDEVTFSSPLWGFFYLINY